MKDSAFVCHYKSPIGDMTIASDGVYITGLWFDGQKNFGTTLASKTTENSQLKIFEETTTWLNNYFAGIRQSQHPKIKYEGSDFREKVHCILQTIPYGETMTYGQIADIIARQDGKRMSAQAVGNAVGHNPISIIVPCHRVVGKKDKIVGYAGGVDKKIWLLELEKKQ